MTKPLPCVNWLAGATASTRASRSLGSGPIAVAVAFGPPPDGTSVRVSR